MKVTRTIVYEGDDAVIAKHVEKVLGNGEHATGKDGLTLKIHSVVEGDDQAAVIAVEKLLDEGTILNFSNQKGCYPDA